MVMAGFEYAYGYKGFYFNRLAGGGLAGELLVNYQTVRTILEDTEGGWEPC